MTARHNLPVPEGPRAPVTLAWFLTTAPPAAIIWTYRHGFSPEKRAGWNNGISTSHEGMAAVLAPGGGWKAFRKYTTPRLRTRRQHGFVLSWMLLILALAVPGLRIHSPQSWAN
jgi:hypothetical protein